MIKKIIKRHKEKQFRKGYDFAAGIILRQNGRGIIWLRFSIHAAKDHHVYDYFDRGAEKALRDAKKLGIT